MKNENGRWENEKKEKDRKAKKQKNPNMTRA